MLQQPRMNPYLPVGVGLAVIVLGFVGANLPGLDPRLARAIPLLGLVAGVVIMAVGGAVAARGQPPNPLQHGLRLPRYSIAPVDDPLAEPPPATGRADLGPATVCQECQRENEP